MSTLARRLIAVVALAVGIAATAGTASAVAAPTTHTVHSTGAGAHVAQPNDWWF